MPAGESMSKKKDRAKLRARPFPDAWRHILEKTVPLYRRLPRADREELHGHVHVFLHEKRFEGCAGLPVTDEIRLTIAAQACVLLLHRDTDYFPGLSSILIYPTTYVAPVVRHEGAIVSEYQEERSGETWDQGSLVLSWDGVTGAVAPAPPSEEDGEPRQRSGNGRSRDRPLHEEFVQTTESDGTSNRSAGETEDDVELVPAYNVVLHEFAHQLDLENGELDGTPRLNSPEQYLSWARVFDAAMKQLAEEIESGVEPVLDDYGLGNEAEFFAIVTESFFETPFALLEEYPDVYRELERYYCQDPAGWVVS